MAFEITSQAAARHVKVTLKDLNDREEIPLRTIYLFPPLFELKIGRASQTDKHLQPTTYNGWFNLKVISREHAILRADPLMEEIYLKDTDSMHGTFLDGVRLESYRDVAVKEGSTFQLGAEIIRGDQTYKPLELCLEVDWIPNITPLARRLFPKLSIPPKNSFTVDYSEDEDNDDDDVEFIGESICVDGPLPDSQPSYRRTFSVPDSEDSESSDIEEIEDIEEEESAPSSPADDLEVGPKTTMSTSMIDGADKPAASRSEFQSTLVEPDFGQASEAAAEIEEGNRSPQNDAVDEDYESSSSVDENDHFSEEESDVDYLDSDVGPDEEEQQAFNDVHLHESYNNEAHANNRAHPRLPSPSDAALPKPSWYQPPKLAGVADIVDQPHSQAIVFPDTFQSASLTPATNYPSFNYWIGTRWANDTGNTFQGSYDHGYGSASMQGSHHNTQQSSGQYLFVPNQQATPALRSPSSVIMTTNCVDIPSAKPSKVSINDIIDDVNPELATSTSNKLKRKADDMCTLSPVEECLTDQMVLEEMTTGPNEHTEDETKSVAVTEILSDTEMIETVQEEPDTVAQKSPGTKKSVTFSSEPAIIVPDVERPRKKQKIEEPNQGTHFFRYLATAVAGATLGAVGTVFGLAALPADYFV